MINNTLRLACQSDAESIAKLVNNAYRPSLVTTGWTNESELVSGSRINVYQVKEAILKPNSNILIEVRNSKIIACVHVEKIGNSCNIGMLTVDPTLQGVGTGKQMLAHAERYAIQEFGSEKFIMTVLSLRIELISFYMRCGYRRTGMVSDYPIVAKVGIPKLPDLKVEILEKIAVFRN
jgi:N-acetylglutamate synthase-like GNAT family acetyltransferase